MGSAVAEPVELRLDEREQAMLDGAEGPAVAMAMRIVTGLARVRGAHRLVPVTGVHVDSCLYHGRAGLDFAQRLVQLGARVRVPTTLNVGSLDLLHPGTVRADAAYPGVLTAGRALMDAYAALGATPTWTCAPYQVGARPGLGEHVAWAESNAVVFANSVLGARTDRYGDFLDICAAVTGRAPLAGLHVDENRRAGVVFDVSSVAAQWWADTSWWAVLGVVVGEQVGRIGGDTGLDEDLVPAIVGLDPGAASEDALKALGAAAASSGAIGMVHAVGITPEAPTLEAALGAAATELRRHTGVPVVRVTEQTLRAARVRLCTAGGPGEQVEVDAVCVGTPHASLAELGRLSAAVVADSRAVRPGVQAVVSTSRGVLAVAGDAVAGLRAAGWQVVVDTCTYVTPILRPETRVVVTNSGKWAHYAPANIGVEVVLSGLDECVAAAATGWVRIDG